MPRNLLPKITESSALFLQLKKTSVAENKIIENLKFGLKSAVFFVIIFVEGNILRGFLEIRMRNRRLFTFILIVLTVSALVYSKDSKKLSKEQKNKQKDDAALMIRPPVLRFTENGARLTWNYNQKKVSLIFGEAGTKGSEVEVFRGTVSGRPSGYYADFSNLENGKNYFYKISGRPAVKFNYGTNNKIILCSDHQTYPELTQKAFNRFKSEKPAFILSCGDMLEDGKIKNWDKNFFQKIPYLGGIPVCASQGNNDTGGPYFRNFFGMDEAYYTFTYGDIRFIAINTNSSTGAGSKQYEWISKVLQNNQSKFTVVFGHHGFYLSSLQETGSEKLRKDLSPLFEKFNVDLVVTGHHHLYNRTNKINGVTYLTLPSVSGDISSRYKVDSSSPYCAAFQNDFRGFGVLFIEENSIRIQLKDLDGKIKDEFYLKK